MVVTFFEKLKLDNTISEEKASKLQDIILKPKIVLCPFFTVLNNTLIPLSQFYNSWTIFKLEFTGVG